MNYYIFEVKYHIPNIAEWTKFEVIVNANNYKEALILARNKIEDISGDDGCPEEFVRLTMMHPNAYYS